MPRRKVPLLRVCVVCSKEFGALTKTRVTCSSYCQWHRRYYKDLAASRKHYREYARRYNKANPDKLKAANAKRREAKNAWTKTEKGKATCTLYLAKKRETLKKATPAWADQSAIKDVYLEASYQQPHVDHMVPLNSKYVCGLHWEGNLQLLTKEENMKKLNKYWPDMWAEEEVNG